MKPDSFYHVYNRGNSFQDLFLQHENYVFFLGKCYQYIPRVATFYAYALLPNHFHFLIKTHPSDLIEVKNNETVSSRISQTFSNLFNSYTKSYNVYYRKRGTLFSQHFKRLPIDSNQYLIQTVLYLHRNGKHHRYCKHYDEWPYTSHHRLMEHPENPIHSEVISWFGDLNTYLHLIESDSEPQNPILLIE